MACISAEETKEGVADADKSSDINLIGRWKSLVFMNGTNYWGTHDIEIAEHSSQGVIAAELIGTSNPGKAYVSYQNRSNYTGVIKGGKVTLTYQDNNSQYTASIILTIGDYAMEGTWNDSNNKYGTNQWFKVYNLKNSNGTNSANSMDSTQNQMNAMKEEMNTLKRRITWTRFQRNVFDQNKAHVSIPWIYMLINIENPRD
eukprot:585806_1